MLLASCYSLAESSTDLVRSKEIQTFVMASIVRTCSPLLSANNEHLSIRLPSSTARIGSESAKRLSSGSIISQADQTNQSQNDIVCGNENGDKATAESRPQDSAFVPIRKLLDGAGFKSNESASGSRELSMLANTADDGTVHVASKKSLSQLGTQDSTNFQDSSQSSPAHGQPSVPAVQKTGAHEGEAKSPDAKLLRPIAVSVPRWRITAAYETASMGSLGKNRFLVRQLAVPSEASARFAQIKETLEADVKRLITGIPSSNQILWSYRLCMAGAKSGTTVAAEPTILISCGSLKCKRKIKGSLLRIRPHYLESLGMTLIVRYDKFAPVLAGLTQAPSSGSHRNWQGDFRVARIQWEPSPTSCGLKIMIEFRYSETTRRAYATLGGVIRLGGVWYGVTTAHPIVSSPFDLSRKQGHDDLNNMSEFSNLSDSSDDEDVQLGASQLLHHALEADLLQIHQNLGFVRLVGAWPGGFMAYSFNGECRPSSGLVATDPTISDWAVLEIPEAYIRPNVYFESSKMLKDGTTQPVSLRSVAGPSQMESGTVHVLCNAKEPHIGYLNMNLVSLQLESGALEVHEVFLEKPMSNGASGSWVAKKDQLVGMVVAISDGGLSCHVVPMWEVFKSVGAVCDQEVQLPGSMAPFRSVASEAEPIPTKQPRHVRFPESNQTLPTSASNSEQCVENQIDRYDDLLSRLVYNQELISKTLSTLTSPGPIPGRFLDPDERSEAFSTLSNVQHVSEPAFGMVKPIDSLSQGSTLVVAKKQVMEKDGEDVYAETVLQTQKLSEEDLLSHIRTPAWTSLAPAILRDLLDRSPLRFSDIASLSLPQDLESPNTILECYDINMEGVATRLHSNSKATKFASWSALTVTNDVRGSHNIVGKMVISKDPTALHLAALHLVLGEDFDMHSILHMLVDDSPSKSYTKGYLEPQIVKQRSFVFSFKYHCIIAEGCKPLPWQESDQNSAASEYGLSLSTCSAIVCLSLSGPSKQSTRRKSHRDQATTVHIFDPFGSWKLLKIQCFPDQISSLEDYESDSRFANGPEAFLVALLSEYRDATSRLKDLHQRISTLVLPPTTLVFDSKLRDKLLFENSNYTLSRRYFWANQVLKLMDKEIEDMVTAYAQSLTDAVWKGEHKYIWPGMAEMGPKFNAWRQRMLSIRKEFDYEITQLQSVRSLNGRLQSDIHALRNQLFTGLALEESKKAVNDSNSIQTFTRVTLLFLPLSFIAEVFSIRFSDLDNDWLRVTAGHGWPLSILTTSLILILISFAFPDTGTYLGRFWAAFKDWVAYAIHYRNSEHSVREVHPKQIRASKGDDFYIRAASEVREKYRKTISKDEALLQGIGKLWLDRRDPQLWFTIWIAIVLGVLTVIFSVVLMVLGIFQLYVSWKGNML